MFAWIITHALQIVVFALACFGIGNAAVSAADPAASRRLPFVLALGYGLLGQTFFILAAFKALTPRAVLIVLAVAVVLALIRIRDLRPPSLLIMIGVLPSFLLALYPPAGYDATTYHLPYARLFADAHALVFAETLRLPVFPQLGEMHFTASLLVADDVTAQLTQWLTLIVTAAAASCIATELGGTRARPLAVALWLGSPLVVFLGANAYIDTALAMSATCAFAAWLIWRRTSLDRWIVLAGAFAGMAASTKYHGLFFVICLLVAAAFISLRAAMWFAVAAAAFAAPWYARIVYETGNPVFPFFRWIFGGSEWHSLIERKLAFGLGIPSDPIFSTVRNAVTDPIAFGAPPYSPFLVLFLPFAVAAAVLERRLRFPLAISAVYVLLVSPLGDWRFMLAIVPLVCASIALVLERLLQQRLVMIATVALLLPGFAWGSILIAKYGLIPHTAAQRDAFLVRRIPMYRALQFTAGSTAYILFAPNAMYYCRGRCIGEYIGPYRYELLQPHMAATLRRFGARYLIVEKSRNVNVPFKRVYDDGAAVVFEVPRGSTAEGPALRSRPR